MRLYLNGQPLKTRVQLDDLNQSFSSREPLRIGAGLGPENRFHGLIQDVRVFRAAIAPDEAAVLAEERSIAQVAATPAGERTPAQVNKLRWCFLDRYAPAKMHDLYARTMELRDERKGDYETFPTVMVMKESPVRRDTNVLIRGAYDRPGDKVSPGLPAILPGLPDGSPNNRLGFAQWLVSPSNPLTGASDC